MNHFSIAFLALCITPYVKPGDIIFSTKSNADITITLKAKIADQESGTLVTKDWATSISKNHPATIKPISNMIIFSAQQNNKASDEYFIYHKELMENEKNIHVTVSILPLLGTISFKRADGPIKRNITKYSFWPEYHLLRKASLSNR